MYQNVLKLGDLDLESFASESGAERICDDLERRMRSEFTVPTVMSGLDCKMGSV